MLQVVERNYGYSYQLIPGAEEDRRAQAQAIEVTQRERPSILDLYYKLNSERDYEATSWNPTWKAVPSMVKLEQGGRRSYDLQPAQPAVVELNRRDHPFMFQAEGGERKGKYSDPDYRLENGDVGLFRRMGQELLDQSEGDFEDSDSLAVGLGVMQGLKEGMIDWNPAWIQLAQQVFGRNIPITDTRTTVQFQQLDYEYDLEKRKRVTISGDGEFVEMIGSTPIVLGLANIETQTKFQKVKRDPFIPGLVHESRIYPHDTTDGRLPERIKRIRDILFTWADGKNKQIPGLGNEFLEEFYRFIGYATAEFHPALGAVGNMGVLGLFNRELIATKKELGPWISLWGKSDSDGGMADYRLDPRKAGVPWRPINIDIFFPGSGGSPGRISMTPRAVEGGNTVPLVKQFRNERVLTMYGGDNGILTVGRENIPFRHGDVTVDHALGHQGLRLLGLLPDDPEALRLISYNLLTTPFATLFLGNQSYRDQANIACFNGEVLPAGLSADYRAKVPILKEIGELPAT